MSENRGSGSLVGGGGQSRSVGAGARNTGDNGGGDDDDSFSRRPLRRAVSIHGGYVVTICVYCGLVVNEDKDRHMKKYHLSDHSFICSLCNEPYRTQKQLNCHRLKEHHLSTPEVNCERRRVIAPKTEMIRGYQTSKKHKKSTSGGSHQSDRKKSKTLVALVTGGGREGDEEMYYKRATNTAKDNTDLFREFGVRIEHLSPEEESAESNNLDESLDPSLTNFDEVCEIQHHQKVKMENVEGQLQHQQQKMPVLVMGYEQFQLMRFEEFNRLQALRGGFQGLTISGPGMIEVPAQPPPMQQVGATISTEEVSNGRSSPVFQSLQPVAVEGVPPLVLSPMPMPPPLAPTLIQNEDPKESNSSPLFSGLQQQPPPLASFPVENLFQQRPSEITIAVPMTPQPLLPPPQRPPQALPEAPSQQQQAISVVLSPSPLLSTLHPVILQPLSLTTSTSTSSTQLPFPPGMSRLDELIPQLTNSAPQPPLPLQATVMQQEQQPLQISPDYLRQVWKQNHGRPIAVDEPCPGNTVSQVQLPEQSQLVSSTGSPPPQSLSPKHLVMLPAQAVSPSSTAKLISVISLVKNGQRQQQQEMESDDEHLQKKIDKAILSLSSSPPSPDQPCAISVKTETFRFHRLVTPPMAVIAGIDGDRAGCHFEVANQPFVYGPSTSSAVPPEFVEGFVEPFAAAAEPVYQPHFQLQSHPSPMLKQQKLQVKRSAVLQPRQQSLVCQLVKSPPPSPPPLTQQLPLNPNQSLPPKIASMTRDAAPAIESEQSSPSSLGPKQNPIELSSPELHTPVSPECEDCGLQEFTPSFPKDEEEGYNEANQSIAMEEDEAWNFSDPGLDLLSSALPELSSATSQLTGSLSFRSSSQQSPFSQETPSSQQSLPGPQLMMVAPGVSQQSQTSSPSSSSSQEQQSNHNQQSSSNGHDSQQQQSYHHAPVNNSCASNQSSFSSSSSTSSSTQTPAVSSVHLTNYQLPTSSSLAAEISLRRPRKQTLPPGKVSPPNVISELPDSSPSSTTSETAEVSMPPSPQPSTTSSTSNAPSSQEASSSSAEVPLPPAQGEAPPPLVINAPPPVNALTSITTFCRRCMRMISLPNQEAVAAHEVAHQPTDGHLRLHYHKVNNFFSIKRDHLGRIVSREYLPVPVEGGDGGGENEPKRLTQQPQQPSPPKTRRQKLKVFDVIQKKELNQTIEERSGNNRGSEDREMNSENEQMEDNGDDHEMEE